MPIPPSLILDTRDEIARYENVLKRHGLDVIDTEQLLSAFFSAITKQEDAGIGLYDVMDTYLALANNDLEGIFDEYDMCGKEFMLLNDLLLELLTSILQKVRDLRMYYNGEIPFDFITILPNKSILLEKNVDD